MTYSHTKIEQKWQKLWLQQKLFATDLNDRQKPKLYLLDMFPYPSGSGLHVGHLRGYLATDILTRMKKMQGFNVLHPIGFDSFGLPAEQYAITTKKDPLPFTEKNIVYFSQQLQNFGFAYDYERIVHTHDPRYYQWTQWMFLQFFQKKLAFITETEINYCPALKTVLANEEIVNLDNKMVSERGEHPVFRQQRRQWILKITDYASRLLSGLNDLDWPLAIKKAQINWIDQKNGFVVRCLVKGLNKFYLKVPLLNVNDLAFVDFIALQLNNRVLDTFLSKTVLTQLHHLRQQFAQKPIVPGDILNKAPVGLFAGLIAINPFNQKEIPIFFAEYVSTNYSYGSKLGMTTRNVQDWFFAKHHQILSNHELDLAKKKQLHFLPNTFIFSEQKNALIKQGQLFTSTFYALRDWVFARQRYWGEPFPIRHQQNQIYPLSGEELPLLLPRFDDLKQFFHQDGAPLANIASWVKQGYDVNTMPQWAGSCWYFLAYLLKKPDGTFWPPNSEQAKQILNYWMPVDLYIGGAEHAVLHLLYARFWNLFISDIGCYDKQEPFQKLRNPGLILASDGKKMSKSKGNFIDPNTFLLSHGADALRLYQQFLGPFAKVVVWNEQGLDAMRKWLARVYRLFVEKKVLFQPRFFNSHLDHIYAVTVKKVTESYDNLSFNVAISQLMVFINHCYKSKQIYFAYGLGFLKLLYPVCPHLAEEIWSLWKQDGWLINQQWPTYDPRHLKLERVNVAIQVNGKTKKLLALLPNLKEKEVATLAKKAVPLLEKKLIKKIIFVENKIINFVF